MRCDTCGASFEPRRRDQRYCSGRCRQRGFAGDRLKESRQALAALDKLRTRILSDVERWEAAASGQRRRRGRNAREPAVEVEGPTPRRRPVADGARDSWRVLGDGSLRKLEEAR